MRWIKGAPTYPGFYWVMRDGKNDNLPQVWKFTDEGEGILTAESPGWECNIDITNFGESNRWHSNAWVNAHCPVSYPPAYTKEMGEEEPEEVEE